MKKIVLSLSASLILFSGCAEKFNNDFKNSLRENVKVSKDIDFSKYTKEKTNKDFYIDFSINRDLKSALNALNAIDKHNVYILDDSQENIIFPDLTTNDSKKLHINSFYKLQQFVKNTTNYLIKLKNPFTKGIKKVIVINKEKEKYDIFNYPFSIHGRVSLQDILNQISKITHFSIVFDNGKTNSNSSYTPLPVTNKTTETSSSASPATPIVLSSKEENDIEFNGKTIGDLLNYISNQFNYFVDVDYKNKLIIFKKYKTFTFNTIFSDVSFTNDKSKIKTIPDYINDMLSSISSFVKDGTFKYKDGIIFARITKKDYEIVSNFIKKMNDEFSKQANLTIEIYIFALKKDIDLGADLSIIEKNIELTTNYNTNSILKVTGYQKTATANLNNSYLDYITKYSYFERVINKIPVTIDFNKDRSYIKSIQQTTTTSTATTTTVQTNIGNIIEGQDITIIPNIYSNKVMLKVLFTNQANEALVEKSFGQNNIVMLPTNTKKTIPANAILKFGERKIVGIYQTYIKYDDVKGLIPTDIPLISRVIGNSEVKFVRELIAVVISVNK